MKKLILPLLLLVVAAIVAAYALNGGFNKVEISRQSSSQKWIAGKSYEGPVKSRKFGALFEEAGKITESGQLRGNLGGIYYNNPAENKGTIKAFVGVVVPDKSVKLPQGYELRELPAGRPVLQARVKAHYSLIAGRAYPALFEYAEENDIALTEEFFEEYLSKDEGIVEVITANKK